MAAAAGDYSPIRTPFFWHSYFFGLFNQHKSDFVFKCQDITFNREMDMVETIRYNWSYASESFLMLRSLFRFRSNHIHVYTNPLSDIAYIIYEPTLFMEGWITAEVVCDYNCKCNKKFKCKACKSNTQITIFYFPCLDSMPSNPNDCIDSIMESMEKLYFTTVKEQYSECFLPQNLQHCKDLPITKKTFKNETKKQDIKPIKPYIVMKMNLPPQEPQEDEYFIQSWM